MDITSIFSNYIENNFDLENNDIKLKYCHSKRVMKLCEEIADAESFNKEDCELSAIAGLLHDYGRFTQIVKYITFDDLKSVDHGNLGAKVLFVIGDIRKYPIDVKYHGKLFDIIKYHNKYAIPEHLNNHDKRILKVVRDADKIDILKLCSITEQPLKEDASGISSEVKKQFFLQKPILIDGNITNNDRIIMALAYIFDINFKYSLKYLKENNVIDNFYKIIIDKEKFKPYFDCVNKYLDMRTGELI